MKTVEFARKHNKPCLHLHPVSGTQRTVSKVSCKTTGADSQCRSSKG